MSLYVLIQTLSVFSKVLEKETITITAYYRVFYTKTNRNQLVCRMSSLILKNIATWKHSVYWSCLSISLSYQSFFLYIISGEANKDIVRNIQSNSETKSHATKEILPVELVLFFFFFLVGTFLCSEMQIFDCNLCYKMIYILASTFYK